MSSGSLGQGVSAAVGMAAAGKFDHKDYRVYTLTGDGEIQEGQIWEAAMWAGHRKLDNLGSDRTQIMTCRLMGRLTKYVLRIRLIRSLRHLISTRS